MRIRDLTNRILQLEKRTGTGTFILRFPDGSSRALSIRDPLALLLACFRRQHAKLAGRPCPTSIYDNTLALMANAERIDKNDVFIELICQEAHK
jgi:hypothetical protein